MPSIQGSPPFSLSWADAQKALRDVALVMLAAALTAGLDWLLEQVTALKDRELIDGALFTLITAMLALGHRWIRNTLSVPFMPLLLAACLLCFGGTAVAETKVLPSPGSSLAVIRSDEPGSQWSAFAIDFDKRTIAPVKLDVFGIEGETGKASLCIVEGTPGSQCAVTRFSPTGQQREMLTVTLGGAPAPPPAPPPGPTPNPPPGPSPTPTPVAGPRAVVLLVQSGTQTTALGTVIRDLRQGSAEQYLKANRHEFFVGDEDNTAFSAWKTAAGTLSRPVLMISDPATSRMLYKATLAPDATADNVIELIKRHGG